MVAGKALVEMTQVVVNDVVRFVFDHFQGMMTKLNLDSILFFI